MPTTVTILALRTIPTLDPKRPGESDTIVAYRADDPASTPDHVILPKSNPSEGEITAAIKAKMTSRSALEGKKITL
jgi:hypothetical protein